MKCHLLITIVAVTGLSACTTLSEEDRSLIMKTQVMAEEARDAAIDAKDEARAARTDANKAAAEAKAAGDKADRIFRQSQNK